MLKFFKSPFFRFVLIIIAGVVEVLATAFLLNYASTQLTWAFTLLDIVLRVLSVIIVLFIVRYSHHLSADIIWIIAIILAPVLGTLLYITIGANLVLGRTYKALVKETDFAEQYFSQDPTVMEELKQEPNGTLGKFGYLLNEGKFPTYRNTGASYYPLGDYCFPQMLEDLRSAEHFIFIEYFIIEPGIFWDSILEILREKVAQGVDVRVLYDDVGSVGTVPYSYQKTMEEQGIKCISFNRLNPILGVIENHRDHRKILVIDGKIAYTGGINLADEYINKVVKFGHWKDNALRVTGEAVWSFTVLFLTTWNALRDEDSDYRVFHTPALPGKVEGYIAPYGETPLDDKLTGQNVYLNIINQATHYCYIMTPYLIIDADMTNALLLAVKRGVDVRIITPGVPDKKSIYAITRSYFAPLIEGGVRIYAYTPGFVHAKVFVSDDTVATVGTINLDYRSLYLHFENGTLMYKTPVVADVYQDVIETLKECHELSAQETKKNVLCEFFLSAARLVTPLL